MEEVTHETIEEATIKPGEVTGTDFSILEKMTDAIENSDPNVEVEKAPLMATEVYFQSKKETKPTELTDELTLKIRALVIRGEKYKDIQETLDINSNTWDTWVYKDYKDFRKNLNSWKAERLIKKSERLSEEILDLRHINQEGKPDTDVLRVKQKEAEYVRSTLGKNEGYSTKTETDTTIKGSISLIDLFNKSNE